MRHTPSSFHRIATSMSTRPPFRPGPSGSRGRGRRNFSDRPPPSTTAVSATFSGDSHSQRHHPYTSNNNNNNNNSRNLNGGFQFQPQIQSYNSRSSPFIRNPNQSPIRKKPADFRIWEYAKHPSPANAERFVVLSYNILADYLANNHRHLYSHIPYRFMSWDWRKKNILFELGLWSPDIMCFQEVDKFHELEEDLRHRGYSGIWKMRTGEPIDGCAIFWRTSRFKLVYEECIEFNKLAMRDNVAQICVLESLIKNHNGKKLVSSESTEIHNRVVICNIHVLYNPKRGEIKLGQVRVLLERAHAVSKKWDDASVVLCGDFNCTPKSPLYNFMSEQKLDISELDRVNISGQASAEIRHPFRQYSHQTRGQSTGYISSPAVIQNINVDGKQTTSVDNQYVADSILRNPPTKKRLSHSSSEPPLNLSTLDVSEKYGNDSLNNMISSGVSGKASPSVEDLSNSKENSSATNVSTDNLMDEDHSTNSDNSTKHDTSAESDNQSDDSHSISSSESDDVNMLSATGDMDSHEVDAKDKPGPTSICEASEPCTSSSFSGKGVKHSGLSLNESVEDNEDLVEDAEAFMSELNNDKDAFPSNLGDLEDPSFTLESQVVNVNKCSYDPSVWTPMEIATATGNANNTVLEHSIQLRSTYTEVEDRSGTRDTYGEPLVTSYNSHFMGTVDYIWRSEGLRTVKVLAPIPKTAMLPTKGFPSKKWGSDHIALASELSFTKRCDELKF